MPRREGTGATDGGPGSGRGMGRGRGQGRDRMGGAAAGIGGMCQCPNCGEEVAHQRGQPCSDMKCPSCGATMTRGNT